MARRPSLSHAHAHARTHTHTHAIYVHCGPHCVNPAACSTTPIVRDALQWTHELGCLFGQSGKLKTIFKSVAKSTSGSYITLKPLCPTRWTVRTPAIDAILGQYEAVLAALEEMASSNTSDTASRANGLHERFQKGTTVLCQKQSRPVSGIRGDVGVRRPEHFTAGERENSWRHVKCS